MKIKFILFFIIIFFSYLYARDISLSSFNARSDGKDISVEWKLNDESSVLQYTVERQYGNQSFVEVFNQKAEGSGTAYTFIDRDAYLKQGDNHPKILGKNVYTYRIKIIKSDYSYNYSDNYSVVHNVSAVRRTWGMIKEMFR